MRMQRCEALVEDESVWLKNDINKATYPVHLLFRDMSACWVADLQKTVSSQLLGHEIVLIMIVKTLRHSNIAQNIRKS